MVGYRLRKCHHLATEKKLLYGPHRTLVAPTRIVKYRYTYSYYAALKLDIL